MSTSGYGFRGFQPAAALPTAAAWPAAATASPQDRFTGTGFCFFLVTLLIPLSAFSWGRLPLPGLQVHAYLVALAPLLLYVAVRRLADFPLGALLCMVVFVTMYIFSVLAGAGEYVSYYQEILKIGGGMGTTLAAALCIRSTRDFRLAVVGIAVGVVALCFKGFSSTTFHAGVNPLEMANENAWSLYSLPPVLLGGLLVLDKSIAKWLRTFLAICVVITAVGILASANRSGWLGLALILLMLLGQGQFFRAAIVLGVVGAISYVLLNTFFTTSVLQTQIETTAKGDTTDMLRVKLFMSALMIGIQRPILGASPQGLYFELAEDIAGHKATIDPHNVVAHLVGGTGLVASLCFFGMMILLWQRGRGVPKDYFGNATARLAHRYLKLLMVLWIIRGLFSREILYMPVFAAAWGICIGWCITQGVWKANPALGAATAAPPDSPPLPTAMPPGGRWQAARRFR